VSSFSNLKISTTLVVIAATPLLFAIVMLAQLVMSAYFQADGYSVTRVKIDHVKQLSVLASRLQVERGLSAGYIGSKGSNNGQKVFDAISYSDDVLEQLLEGEGGFSNFANLNHISKWDDISAGLSNLTELRKGIRDLNVGGAESMARYSEMIAGLLNVGVRLAGGLSDVELSLAAKSYLQLLWAGEFAGQERGMVAGAIGQGVLDETVMAAVIGSEANQRLSVANTKTGVPVYLRAEIDKLLSAIDMVPLNQARSEILSVGLDGSLADVDGADWFAIASARIAGLQNASDTYSDRLGTLASQAEASARNRLIIALGLGFVALVFAIGLVVICARSLSRPLSALTKSMDNIQNGELDTIVPFAKRTNEIGKMANSLEKFRQNAMEIAKLSENEKAQQRDARDRAVMLERLQSSLSEAVGLAAQGDFSKSVDMDFEDPGLAELAQSANNLIDNVDRGIGETVRVLGGLADKDLTVRMSGQFDGAFASLKTDVNTVADKLETVIGQLDNTSKSLKHSTDEILAGANDLSDRTTRQAASIEETSAAMEQLSGTVTDNSKEASAARQSAQGVESSAENGGEIMKRTTEAMARISSSSEEISKIIGLIDDIAFQTNLLALNASVEAARAGEAGKGFAVVAIEVRRLAQSAANASSDVKKLIEQSAAEVSEGNTLVESAVQSLDQILEGARTNGKLVVSIATNSAAQATSIEQISAAVREMDEATQQNAALVQETNAAIEQTQVQANALTDVVDEFNTGGESHEGLNQEIGFAA